MTPEPRPTGASTLALTALTAAAAVGMGRLFAGSAYLVAFLAAAVVSHGVMWAGRRLGAPLPVTAVAAMGALALTAAWLVLPGTTTFGIPGGATLDAARDALSEAWVEFAEVVAPAPVTDGFLIAGMAAIGLTAVLADWAAFRMAALFEAVIPSFTLFIFTATLGSPQRRALLVGLYVAALLLFLLVHQAGMLAASSSWFASRSRHGVGALLERGAVLGVVTVMAALTVGPSLPGADQPPVLAWRDSDLLGTDSRRTTISPLVDIRGRLVNQSTAEVFTVRSDQRSYWRLTSLDTFDGQIWSSDATHRPVRQKLPRGLASEGRDETVVQEFKIASLSSLWLPAAYRPERLEGVSNVSYNEDLGSLITNEETTDGLTYRVESALPRFSPAELNRAASGLTGDQARRFRQLPAIPPRVLALADSVANQEPRATAYDKALALQNFFRDGAFAYDLGVEPGHGDRALENFLFRTRRGYCEQFAGAYAVLARAAGLPTRVAVGFTTGELGDDGLFHVRGLNAHAWPEVYLAGAGWVAFEPTPGRGAPGAESYTGVPEAQARPESPSTASTAAPATTTAPNQPATPTTATATTTPPGGDQGSDGHSVLDNRALRAVLVALAAAAVVCAAVPAAKAARRRRRRRAATTGAERVLVAWSEAAEALAQAGARREPAETLDEHARRAAGAAALAPAAAGALAALAGDAAAASYARDDVSSEVASRAQGSAAVVEAALKSSASPGQRARRAVDPRPLVRS